jgi:hypothetical protein
MNKKTLLRQQKDKKVYMWLLDFLTQYGRWPVLREIGQKYGVSRERARVIMDNLVRDGYIIKGERQKVAQASVDYHIKINELFVKYALRGVKKL